VIAGVPVVEDGQLGVTGGDAMLARHREISARIQAPLD
jgi:hypothetical protein